MITRTPRAAALVLLALLSACQSGLSAPPATVTAVLTGVPLTRTATLPATPGPRVLRVWLPAQFDPNADTQAARLLKARLDQYAQAHPEVILDLRIKAEAEPASLLEMLSLAGVAAPETLPDLVALPREDVEDAALKGIIHPIEGLTQVLDDSRWYSYARQLAHVQNSAYGLPFAGEALVLAYDRSRFLEPPQDWDTLMRRPGALPLAVNDPQVLLLLSLYRSTNGGLLDAQNRPMLEEFALLPTLRLLERARINGTQWVDSESEAWEQMLGGRAAWTVTRVTRALAEPSEAFDLAALPGLNDDPYTLATTWTWVLAGSDPENEASAIALAEWLIQDEFLNEWVNAAGYLPTRSSDLNQRFPALSTTAETAQPVPSNDLMAALAPVLQQAAARIQAGDPVETVTQDAVQALR